MPSQGWRDVVYQEGAGSAITAAAEDELASDVTFPAGYFVPGRMIKLTLVAKASNVVTTPGTIQFRVRWGTISGTVLVDSTALAQNTAAQTDKTVVLEVWVLCLTAGATGTFLTWGKVVRGNAATIGYVDALPPSSLAAVTVDTLSAKALTVSVQPSLATASITRMAYLVESLN